MKNTWSKEYPEFTPNVSPTEMFLAGIFGGQYFYCPEINADPEYFRQIIHPDFLAECKELGIMQRYLNSYSFGSQTNYYYQGFCGSTYKTWKKNNWLNSEIPYGWVNWYINFYYGTRTSQDARQIARWKSFTARHIGMLKKYRKKGQATAKTQQNLLHWAYFEQKLKK